MASRQHRLSASRKSAAFPRWCHTRRRIRVSKRETLHCLPDCPEEAHYIAGILNSPHLDAELKPLQSKRDFGPRDIHKKMWAFLIPTYDDTSSAHKNLAALGAECSRASGAFVAGLTAKIREGSLGRLRALIRENLKHRIAEIDSIVKDILQ